MQTPSRQLTEMFERARPQGWIVGSMSKDRFKLTHPQAHATVIAPADTKAIAAIRKLEAEMTRALGPVQTMSTPKLPRVSKAALKTKSPDELRALFEQESDARKALQTSLHEATQELARSRQASTTMELELTEWRDMRSALQRLVLGKTSGSAKPGIAKPGVAKLAAPIDGPAKKAAAPATKKASAAGAAPAKKASAKKNTAPGKRGSGSKKAEVANGLLAKTPLEEAIEDRKQKDAGGGADATAAISGESPTRKTAGPLIRAHRTARKETQQYVAGVLLISPTTLINWEMGTTLPQNGAMGRVAAYLALPPHPGAAQLSSAET